MLEIIIDEKLINNGTAKILKVRRDAGDKWINGDGFAIKYDHKKAIEGVYYDVHEVDYDFGNDYEMLDATHITNTYLLSVYQFIRECDPRFIAIDGGCINRCVDPMYNYLDDSDPNRPVNRILPPEETDGFRFKIDFMKFFGRESGICTSETVKDGDYLVIIKDKRPISLEPERFFKDGFEIVGQEIIIPKISFDICNINFEQFKAIYDVLNSTGEYFNWQVPDFVKDEFYAAMAKYDKEKKQKENEQNV